MAFWNGAIAAKGSAPRASSRERSAPTLENSAEAMVAIATLSSSVGASLASSARRSKALISPYAMTPSRSTIASR